MQKSHIRLLTFAVICCRIYERVLSSVFPEQRLIKQDLFLLFLRYIRKKNLLSGGKEKSSAFVLRPGSNPSDAET